MCFEKEVLPIALSRFLLEHSSTEANRKTGKVV